MKVRLVIRHATHSKCLTMFGVENTILTALHYSLCRKNTTHKSPAGVGGEVARNQALKISRLFLEKLKTMVEIKLKQQQNSDICFS